MAQVRVRSRSGTRALIGFLRLSRFLESLLFDLPATDPISHILSAVLMAGVAGAASYGPAKRAASIDPWSR